MATLSHLPGVPPRRWGLLALERAGGYCYGFSIRGQAECHDDTGYASVVFLGGTVFRRRGGSRSGC